jgi:hypothetical protein
MACVLIACVQIACVQISCVQIACVQIACVQIRELTVFTEGEHITRKNVFCFLWLMYKWAAVRTHAQTQGTQQGAQTISEYCLLSLSKPPSLHRNI